MDDQTQPPAHPNTPSRSVEVAAEMLRGMLPHLLRASARSHATALRGGSIEPVPTLVVGVADQPDQMGKVGRMVAGAAVELVPLITDLARVLGCNETADLLMSKASSGEPMGMVLEAAAVLVNEPAQESLGTVREGSPEEERVINFITQRTADFIAAISASTAMKFGIEMQEALAYVASQCLGGSVYVMVRAGASPGQMRELLEQTMSEYQEGM